MSATTSPWAWQPARPSRLVESVSLIRLEGPDSLRVLHGQTSQAIEGARAGQLLATCIIGPTARLRGLAEVLVDRGGAWLVVTAGEGALVHQALDRVLFPADQVTLGAVETATLITPLGPAPADPLPAAAPGHWEPLGDEGPQGWLLGKRLLWRDGPALPAPWGALSELDPVEQELWRLRQGFPAAPGELNDDTNPFELGLADRVSLSKGCYVGQETLAKLSTYDGVKQQLRRFVSAPGAPRAALAAGSVLVTAAGERAGKVSSCLELTASSAGTRQVVGLALVRRQALAEPVLWAGGAAGTGWALELSLPEAFVAPPLGAGRPKL
ncbi:folate-binding protein [Cyanobium sp. ATX 6F1]|uniref:CAF17-like 4Fe-4S cluster assembly/insertion protein YgfZ n=1 Tax=unclassified Cyanobium TaxID=2627006 RepID=UPI0020CDBBE2|nr:folate-binding protein [Cyanobium sp. ATX 6F1]MCP9916591.1 folate-binding protein [Cyanobium sp. ATX 6F1]